MIPKEYLTEDNQILYKHMAEMMADSPGGTWSIIGFRQRFLPYVIPVPVPDPLQFFRATYAREMSGAWDFIIVADRFHVCCECEEDAVMLKLVYTNAK